MLFSDEHYDSRCEHKMAFYDLRGAHRICGTHSEGKVEDMHAQQLGVLRSESTRAALRTHLNSQGRSTIAAFCKALEVRLRPLSDPKEIQG